MFVTSLIGFSIGLIYLLSSIAIIWGLRFQFIFNGILLAILTSLFIALIILCYYFLISMFSNNSLLSLILTWVYTIILPILLHARKKILYPLFDNELIHKFIDLLYYIVPQVAELKLNITKLLFNENINANSFIYSALFYYSVC